MSSSTRFLKLITDGIRRFSQHPDSSWRWKILEDTTRLYSPFHMSRVLSSSTRTLQHQSLTQPQGQGHRYLSNYSHLQRRNFSVYNGGVQQGAPLPPQPPSSPLKWITGIVLTIVLPFVGNTWGPALKYKVEVETVVETIEDIVDVVEKVAEVVDKVAEGIEEMLPEGDKLKKLLDEVEDRAEETAKDAQALGDAIDKFQEVEGKVGNLVGTLRRQDKPSK